MEAPSASKPIAYNRWLPYWAVLQADVQQTMRSWVYRFWVLVTLLAMAGYLIYRIGPYREAGIIQQASVFVSDILRWSVLGSVALIVVLSTSAISGERGTMADSVLSRGISRYQYYLGKWHARLATMLGTFAVFGLAAVVSSLLLLHEDLDWQGCGIALGSVLAMLTLVISFSVAMSAMTNNTLLGIAVVWMVLYGGGFALSLMPGRFPAPDQVLQRLPNIVRGSYNLEALGNLIGWSLAGSVVTALLGLLTFARRDV